MINYKKIYVDLDGTLAEWKTASNFSVLYEKGYFNSLKPHKKLIKALTMLIDDGAEVYVLSAYLTDSKYALKEKNEWLNKYFPIATANRIFVPYGNSKNKYASPNSLLIDDYNKNLLEWSGIGIKALNGINDVNKSYQGERINVFDSPKSIYQKIKALL